MKTPLLFAALLFTACARDSATGPIRTGPMRMDVASNAAPSAAGPTIVDLWGGPGFGDYASAINEAGVVVGLFGLQVQTWDRGNITPVATLPFCSGCGPDRAARIGINAKGQVVGSQNLHAYVWDSGTLTNLGASVGLSFASWINNRSDVLGGALICAGDLRPFIRIWERECSIRGIVWQDGSPIDIGTLGGNYSGPVAINAAGEVVGTAELAHGRFELGDVHAFLWKDGVMTDLGTLGGHLSGALDINPSGRIVGWAETADGVRHATLWDHGTATDLGPGAACAINPSGEIAGMSGGNAVVWFHGTMFDLGVPINDCAFPVSFPPVINTQGLVAVNSCDPQFTCTAYLWTGIAVTRLADLGGGHATVYDINSKGVIVGQSTNASGEFHAVLWMP